MHPTAAPLAPDPTATAAALLREPAPEALAAIRLLLEREQPADTWVAAVVFGVNRARGSWERHTDGVAEVEARLRALEHAPDDATREAAQWAGLPALREPQSEPRTLADFPGLVASEPGPRSSSTVGETVELQGLLQQLVAALDRVVEEAGLAVLQHGLRSRSLDEAAAQAQDQGDPAELVELIAGLISTLAELAEISHLVEQGCLRFTLQSVSQCASPLPSLVASPLVCLFAVVSQLETTADLAPLRAAVESARNAKLRLRGFVRPRLP